MGEGQSSAVYSLRTGAPLGPVHGKRPAFSGQAAQTREQTVQTKDIQKKGKQSADRLLTSEAEAHVVEGVFLLSLFTQHAYIHTAQWHMST
jgi:hypothetical protein